MGRPSARRKHANTGQMACDGIDSGPTICLRLINPVGFDKAHDDSRSTAVEDNGRFQGQNDTPTTATTATLFPANQYYENNEAYCTANNSPPLQQAGAL